MHLSKMTKLIMHLLPYSRDLGYCLTYKKCLYLLRNGIYGFSSLPLLVNHTFDMFINVPFSRNLCKHFHTYFQRNCESIVDTTSDEIEEIEFPLIRNIEVEEYSEQFRNTLYPTSSDPIITQIKSSDNVTQLLHILNVNSSTLTSEHYCQFILVLWDLLKSVHTNRSITIEDDVLAFDILSHHGKIVTSNLNSILYKVLGLLSVDVKRLTPEALVCSILYSHRLGVSLKHPSIQTLLMRINDLLLKDDAQAFSLSALSRLTITLIENNDELWTKLYLIKTLPFIYGNFDSCSSVEDFRALTISMLSTVSYLREDVLVEYEALTEELLRNGTLTRDQTSTIVKAILLLSHIYHKPNVRHMIYKLFQMLNGDLNKLFLAHLLNIHKIVWQNIEPQYTISELKKLKKSSSMQLTTSLSVMSSTYIQLFNLPPNPQGSLILKDIIRNVNQLEDLLCVQQHLSTTNMEACHMFWDKVAQLVTSAVSYNMLPKVCLRYMNFSARMGLYRHKQFESQILSLIMMELVNGMAGHLPHSFAPLAAFVLSYGHSRYATTSLSSDIVPRLLSMIGQFNIEGCFILSQGLRQGIYWHRSSELQSYLQLDTALNDRTKEILRNSNDFSISTFNILLRSCINRKGPLESDILWDILKRCEQLDWSQMTSRSLRKLVYNFHITSALVPTAVDQMVEYCLQNRQYVTGDTVSKLAYMCYWLGYTPTHGHNFCVTVADLVFRDRDMPTGLGLLQVALALSFFQQLPASLHRFIFTVNFLERLDDEIKNCFAKDKYPLKVRQTLMQLNRSMCLDQPEADIPWFHSKFCEEQRALGQLEMRPKSLLFTDVLSALTSLIGDSNCINTRAYTPYGYAIDIQLTLDASLNPVAFKDPQNVVNKLAFLLHYGDSYTICERRLKGYQQMKQRHLEILGYKVIGLSDSLWNAMFMAEPKAKVEYLKKLIWPS